MRPGASVGMSGASGWGKACLRVYASETLPYHRIETRKPKEMCFCQLAGNPGCSRQRCALLEASASVPWSYHIFGLGFRALAFSCAFRHMCFSPTVEWMGARPLWGASCNVDAAMALQFKDHSASSLLGPMDCQRTQCLCRKGSFLKPKKRGPNVLPDSSPKKRVSGSPG